MIPSIARQSVIIKCKIKKSGLLGNYEFYYGAGLLSGLSGAALPKEGSPKELKNAVLEAAADYEPKNDEEKYLIKCLREVAVSEQKDDEMEELFRIGRNEDRPWQI